MEAIKNIVKIISIKLENFQSIFYFSAEIILFLAMFINILLFLFFAQKSSTKRLSDKITFGTLILNLIISSSLFIRDKLFFNNFEITFLKDNLIFNQEISIFQILLFLFFISFISITYKIARKTRFNIMLVNTSLLGIILTSLFLIKSQNIILNFIFLDIIVFFVYKYASNYKLRKFYPFSKELISINLISTIVFYLSYFLSNSIAKTDFHTDTLNICASCAILLKAGIFPIFNYASNRCYKNNLPYSILLYVFVPFVGIITYFEFIQNINYLSSTYFLTMNVFLISTIFLCSIYAFKVKNLVRYLANCFYIYSIIHIFAFFTFVNTNFVVNSLFMVTLAFLAIYSLFCILKINFKQEKINLSFLEKISSKNTVFVGLFSVLLLIQANIIPSAVMLNHIKLIKNILLQNELSTWILLSIFFAVLLIILKTFKLIKTMFFKENQNIPQLTLTKRTTPNYVVPCLIILFLIIKMFL